MTGLSAEDREKTIFMLQQPLPGQSAKSMGRPSSTLREDTKAFLAGGLPGGD